MKIITGMHRSGTSLVARLFLEAGADMGDADSFYRPDKWNPDGYYEQPDIHAVNMPLINGPFWKFSYFFLPSTQTILRRADKISERIVYTARQYSDKLVKETRFCLTLPAWIKNGAKVIGIVICIREPIQVAQSLRKRNKISIKRAFGLWRLHHERLLAHIGGLPRWFVYYNNILDPERMEKEVITAYRFFGYNLSHEAVHAICTKCVKPELNKNPVTSYDYPNEIRILWEQLKEAHRKQFDAPTPTNQVH